MGSSKVVPIGILAVVGLITIKVVTVLFALTLGFFAIMFKIIPIILIVWLIWRGVKYLSRPSSATS